MRTVITGSKGDGGQIAVAIDLNVVQDPKVLGAFLKLIGECNFAIDRVNFDEVIFTERAIASHPPLKDTGYKQTDFTSGEVVGPSEMGEGFTCTYSGACPNEKKSCTTCEYAGSIFGAPVEAKADEAPADQPAEGAQFAEELNSSEFAKWAKTPAEVEASAERDALAEPTDTDEADEDLVDEELAADASEIETHEAEMEY